MSLIGNVSIFKTLAKTWLCVDCSEDISTGHHFDRVHYSYLCGGVKMLDQCERMVLGSRKYIISSSLISNQTFGPVKYFLNNK